ncbi:hypothetical protein, partial [Mesorhizobium intechi]|uniref:hypothetical protein n=1 Tax=Mesorhizobium intechi TaxID=537601 RepID=UPI001ABF63F8
PEPDGPGEALDAPTSDAPAPVSRSSTVVPSGAARTGEGRSRRFGMFQVAARLTVPWPITKSRMPNFADWARTAFLAPPRNVPARLDW